MGTSVGIAVGVGDRTLLAITLGNSVEDIVGAVEGTDVGIIGGVMVGTRVSGFVGVRASRSWRWRGQYLL